MHIGIMGAGSIGCYVGGRLAAKGHSVTLIGRQALATEIAEHGLTITDCDGYFRQLDSSQIRVALSAEALETVDVVLVSVKSSDTAEAATLLKHHLKPGALVVSFQNGVRNASVLRSGLPDHRTLAAMVPFNVLRKPKATFHRGTSGNVTIEHGDSDQEATLLAALRSAGIPAEATTDIQGVQWGKLLINLNNAVNALSGIPVREQMGRRAFRMIAADVMSEALTIMNRVGIRPVAMIKAPLWVMIQVMRLPDAIFLRLADAMIKIDPEARSSMWEDLQRHRKTEIDQLCGEVVRLAGEHGMKAPLNQKLVELIRIAEHEGKGSPKLSAGAIAAALKG